MNTHSRQRSPSPSPSSVGDSLVVGIRGLSEPPQPTATLSRRIASEPPQSKLRRRNSKRLTKVDIFKPDDERHPVIQENPAPEQPDTIVYIVTLVVTCVIFFVTECLFEYTKTTVQAILIITVGWWRRTFLPGQIGMDGIANGVIARVIAYLFPDNMKTRVWTLIALAFAMYAGFIRYHYVLQNTICTVPEIRQKYTLNRVTLDKELVNFTINKELYVDVYICRIPVLLGVIALAVHFRSMCLSFLFSLLTVFWMWVGYVCTQGCNRMPFGYRTLTDNSSFWEWMKA